MPDPTTKGSTPGPGHYRRQLVGELRRPVDDGSLPVGHDNRKLELEELVGEVVDGTRLWVPLGG
jgi:hypothetical protein